MKTIDTERLHLSWLEEKDTAFVLELLNSEGWLRFIGDRNIKDEASAKAYIHQVNEHHQKHQFGFLKVSLRETNTPLGICGLINRNTLPQIDIGFAFLAQYMGKGYAYEAAKVIVEYAKNTLQLTHLLAITLPENHSSRKLLEKLGMQCQKMIIQNEEELMLYEVAFLNNYSKA